MKVAFRGDLEPEELLDRQDEDELVVLEADIVDALRVRDRLPPRLVLHRLLEAGVEVADHCLGADDALALEVDDQAQDAVHRRVVRPEVDAHDVLAALELGRRREDGRDRGGDPRALVDPRALDDRHYSLFGEADGLAADRIVLPQRVPLPVVLHQDPAKVRVPLEADSHHVPRLALVPVGGRPDRDHALERLAVVDPDLEADTWRAVPQCQQVVVDREALRLRARDSSVPL